MKWVCTFHHWRPAVITRGGWRLSVCAQCARARGIPDFTVPDEDES
jgi:sulfur relay (sulfurtransferase) complex TusBCD TusD component (DsrE family)